MKISEAMTKAPHSIEAHRTLNEAQAMMEKYDVRHLPVLVGGKIEGVLSERDFAILHNFPGTSMEETTCEELMLTGVYTVNEDTEVRQVVTEMAEQKIGSAVVTTDDGHVSGIFTVTDALYLLARTLS